MPNITFLANNVTGNTSRHRFSKHCLIISWSLFILTMTRPQWLDAPIVQTSPSRDLLLAVDVSYSMQIKDMTLNGQSIQRLDMVKSYLQSFIKTTYW